MKKNGYVWLVFAGNREEYKDFLRRYLLWSRNYNPVNVIYVSHPEKARGYGDRVTLIVKTGNWFKHTWSKMSVEKAEAEYKLEAQELLVDINKTSE